MSPGAQTRRANKKLTRYIIFIPVDNVSELVDVLLRGVHKIPQSLRFPPERLEIAPAHHGLDGVQTMDVGLASAFPSKVGAVARRDRIDRRSRYHRDSFDQVRTVDGTSFAALFVQFGQK